MSYIQMRDAKAAEDTMRKTWNELRDALSDGTLKADDIDTALTYTFLKVFGDIFRVNKEERNCKRWLEEFDGMKFVRCARIDEGTIPSFERFIPKSEFIKEDNRFSPPGVEWLYLAWAKDMDLAKQCAQAECRIKPGESVGLCEFETVRKKAQIFDLTIADHHTYESINAVIDEYIASEAQALANQVLTKGLSPEKIASNKVIEERTREMSSLWAVFTYARMLSSQIFVPVETNKTYMYAPFHCMAYYFQSLGYDGIAYSSTVSDKGKNLVLFNKNDAKPIGKVSVSVCK